MSTASSGGRRRGSAARMLRRSRVEEEWPGSCGREVELKAGSARAELPWRSGATVSSSSPAFGWAVAAFWGFGAGNWRESEGIGMRECPWC